MNFVDLYWSTKMIDQNPMPTLSVCDRRRFLILSGGAALAVISNGLLLSEAAAASSLIVTNNALAAVNAYRRANGRGNLRTDATLGRAAQSHSISMARSGRISHRQFKQRMRQFGIKGYAAENVASGQKDIERVLRAWKRSSGHRRNMLGNYSRVGLAVAYRGDRPFWTMMLAG